MGGPTCQESREKNRSGANACRAFIVRSTIRRFAAYLRNWDRNGPERAGQRARNIQRIALLSRFIAPGGVGVELGVPKGYFSPVLLEGLAPEKLYLIDPWYLQGKEWTWGEGNRRAVDALGRILLDAGGRARDWKGGVMDR